MVLGVTGQRNKDRAGVVTPDPLPIVAAWDILHYESTLNNSEISGKREGSMVVVVEGDNKGIYVATGSGRADKWIYLHGVTEDDVSRDTVRELDDMVDVEFEGFDTMLQITEERITTKVIETPVLLLDGSYGYRCRMTFHFNFKKKSGHESSDSFPFAIKLINATGSEGTYYIVDHGTFTGWNTGGAVIGHIDLDTAKTNYIPVMIKTTGSTNFYHAAFSLEWTATESIAEG
jgi:hypothetical protein|nr:MAG TPA: hypothetical protein [Caudoviricetes sp.]